VIRSELVSNPRLLSTIAVGLSALLLSGCAGGASPGVGVTVGDETISAARIDSATAHLCTAFSDQLQGQQVPLSVVKQRVVQLFALRAQADQIAEEYAISPSSTYQRELAEHTRAAALMPEEVREDYVDFVSASSRTNDVVEQVGRGQLLADGVTDPTVEQVTEAGAKVFAAWPDANGIETNPKYGLTLKDGQLVPADTNLSYAVSEEAKAGNAIEPDPAYAKSLPSSQRCG
jgi:hypothetical protein